MGLAYKHLKVQNQANHAQKETAQTFEAFVFQHLL